MNSLQSLTAVSGVGMTAFSHAAEGTVLDLALEAAAKAIDDAGLDKSEVDGLIGFSYHGDSVLTRAVATGLGLGELTYAADLEAGGQAPSFAVAQAAMAVRAGMAKHVIVYRALKGRSESRVGRRAIPSPSGQYHYPLGITAYPQFIATWARRFMVETGTTEEQLGAVVLAQREYAAANEHAIRRTPLTMDEYLAQEMVVDPFRRADCTIEVDGAAAVLVTSLERARELAPPPAVIRGSAWSTGAPAGIGGDDVFQWPDMSRNFTGALAERLWASAGLGAEEMDFAQIYDCFSSTVLFGLEGLGLVGRGEAGAFVADGNTAKDGALPVNTGGGLLCEGYLHGMNTLVEAVVQVQGRAGDRQLGRAEVGVITSGAQADGSALVVTVDR
ncbi:MAG TPA: hypothetical protein VHZ54_03845 [Solirubrobacterales bacterium]|jgi:acetyl-CoA acetyltransferase|nr:hypothetical protein [Solirubrobacterales bacterium]